MGIAEILKNSTRIRAIKTNTICILFVRIVPPFALNENSGTSATIMPERKTAVPTSTQGLIRYGLRKPSVKKISGSEAIKIPVEGDGNPKNISPCRVSILNFAKRSAAKTGTRKEENLSKAREN
jgi:hypothetical protein